MRSSGSISRDGSICGRWVSIILWIWACGTTYWDGDSGHILENIIYFELLRQGYDVAIGKIDNQEVDFIATKADEKKYIQVTENMHNPETRERELAPLRKIRDNYEKLVIALDCDLMQTQDGIKIMKAFDFLLI